MRRTNVILDPALLDEAMRASGERSQSAVIRRALEEFVKRLRARRILELRGSGAWDGDLSCMREDGPARRQASTSKTSSRSAGRRGPR